MRNWIRRFWLPLALVAAGAAAVWLLPTGFALGAPTADIAQFADWRAFAAQTIRSGHLPLWNPYEYSGVPFLGGFQSALLYPPNVLFLFLPLIPALNLSILLHLEILGLGMARWAVRRKLHPCAALICGLAIVCSGPVFPHVFAGHLANICSMAWAPWILADLEAGAKGAGWRAWLRAAAGICLQILAGHPQYVVFTAIAAGIQAAITAYMVPSTGRRATFGFFGIYLGAALLAAAQLFPGLSASAESVRTGGLSVSEAAIYSFPPENLLTLVAPNLFGHGLGSAYWGRWFSWEMSLYAGITGLVFAGMACLDRERRRVVVADGVACVLLFVLALGSYTPLFPLLHSLPVLDQIRGFSKFTFPGMLFFVLMIGTGADAVFRGRLKGRIVPVAALVFGAIAIAAGLGLWTHPAAIGRFFSWVIQTGETRIAPTERTNAAFQVTAGLQAAKSLVLSGAALLVVGAALLGMRRRPWLRWIPAAVFAVEMICFAASWIAGNPLGEISAEPLAKFIRNHPGDYRVRIYGNGSAPGFLLGAHNLEGDDPSELRRYAEFMAFSEGANPDLATQRVPPGPPWVPLHAILRSRLLYLVDASGKGTPYEAHDPLPRVQLISGYRVLPGKNQIFASMADPSFDPRKLVLLEQKPEPRPAPFPIQGVARVVSEAPDCLTIEADASAPALLLVTDPYSHDWHARALPGSVQEHYDVLPADYILRAIPLSAGHHRIQLVYEPISLKVGLAVSLCAWVLWLGLWIKIPEVKDEIGRPAASEVEVSIDRPILGVRPLEVLQAAVILFIGWWAFSPALHGDFIWDDHSEITNNPYLHDTAGLQKIWFAHALSDYFPLKTTLQWGQWHLWGEDSTGYHATNLALHLLSALLLWRLLRKLGVRSAWLGGLLFAVHPLTVESVSWISELKNTLSLPLLLLAMNAYLDWDAGSEAPSGTTKAKTGSYVLAVALFIAAMLSKSSVVMFPVILLLHAWWRRGKVQGRDLRAAVPFFCVSLVLGLVTVWFQWDHPVGPLETKRWAANSDMPNIEGIYPRIVNAGLITAFYLGKCLWPLNLVPLYPRWTINPTSILQLLPWFVGVIVLAWLWVKRDGKRGPGSALDPMARIPWQRHVLFGLGCFFLSLVPVLGFVPMSYFHFSWVADHLAYLALVPVIGLAVAAFDEARSIIDRKRRPNLSRSVIHKNIAFLLPIFVMTAFVLSLAWESHDYAPVFQTEENLWGRTLSINPGSATAHFNLGSALIGERKNTEAIAEYKIALRLKPDDAETHSNLGIALMAIGKTREGSDEIKEALRLEPDNFHFRINLGNAFAAANHPDDAIDQYNRVLQMHPDDPSALRNLESTLLQSGRLDEAIANGQEALRVGLDFPDIHGNLGTALMRKGRGPEAITQFEDSLRLEPGNPSVHFQLGDALKAEGRIQEAKRQMQIGQWLRRRAMRSRPAPSMRLPTPTSTKN